MYVSLGMKEVMAYGCSTDKAAATDESRYGGRNEMMSYTFQCIT